MRCDTGKKLVRGAEVWKESGRGYTQRPQREGHLGTQKKSKRTRYSLSGDRRRERSGYRKKETE